MSGPASLGLYRGELGLEKDVKSNFEKLLTSSGGESSIRLKERERMRKKKMVKKMMDEKADDKPVSAAELAKIKAKLQLLEGPDFILTRQTAPEFLEMSLSKFDALIMRAALPSSFRNGTRIFSAHKLYWLMREPVPKDEDGGSIPEQRRLEHAMKDSALRALLAADETRDQLLRSIGGERITKREQDEAMLSRDAAELEAAEALRNLDRFAGLDWMNRQADEATAKAQKKAHGELKPGQRTIVYSKDGNSSTEYIGKPLPVKIDRSKQYTFYPPATATDPRKR